MATRPKRSGVAGWYDGKGLDLDDRRLVKASQRWRKYLADGKITQDEIEEQKELIDGLLKKIEPKLTPEIHEELTVVLVELMTLTAMYERRERFLTSRECAAKA